MTELGLPGFCRTHLPDPACQGGPQYWNDLSAWEYGYTGSGSGGRKTFNHDWNVNQHDYDIPSPYKPQHLDAFLRVRGVRNKFGRLQEIRNITRHFPGFGGKCYRFPFLDAEGQPVPLPAEKDKRWLRCWHGSSQESTWSIAANGKFKPSTGEGGTRILHRDGRPKKGT